MQHLPHGPGGARHEAVPQGEGHQGSLQEDYGTLSIGLDDPEPTYDDPALRLMFQRSEL